MTESEAYDPKRDLERMKAEVERLQGEHTAVTRAVLRELKEAQRALDEAMQALMAVPEDEVTEDHPKALAVKRAVAESEQVAKEGKAKVNEATERFKRLNEELVQSVMARMEEWQGKRKDED
ncbi:MAG: hypothetical protein OXH15_08440 [Gammaproteobacteria bacterium]|nr:hypothetical protein [Gammaproteobacteria bacterium]